MIAQIRPEVPSTVTHVILFVRDRPLVPTAAVYAIVMVVDPNIRAHMSIREMGMLSHAVRQTDPQDPAENH